MTPDEARAVLDTVSHRQVRSVAASHGKPEAVALFEFIKARKVSWELSQWHAVLKAVDACELTVGEWLDRSSKQD